MGHQPIATDRDAARRGKDVRPEAHEPPGHKLEALNRSDLIEDISCELAHAAATRSQGEIIQFWNGITTLDEPELDSLV